ncbi:MAG: S8 family serine peptidase [Proteobacteria bacterium]|nr:S8 family serine peptidase [Pseudomonadota bacterium]
MKTLFALLAVLVFASAPALPGPAGAYSLSMDRDRMSVEARGEPLARILEGLAARGVKVYADPGANPPVTLSLADRDARRVLDALVRPYSWAAVWDTVQTPDGPFHRLAELSVFRPGFREAVRPLVVRPVLDVARDPATGELYVNGEVLIRFAPGTPEAEIQRIMTLLGATVLDRHEATGVWRVKLPEGAEVYDAIRALEKEAAVAGAEPNQVFRAPSLAPGPGAAPAAFAIREVAVQGDGPAVAVLDTGLLSNAGLDALVRASTDIFAPGGPVTDPQGHGTQMAWVASGLVSPQGAPETATSAIPVVAVRVFDDNGCTSAFHVAEALDFAAENGARVVNLSWGSETKSELLEEAFSLAEERGMILVAAAGNEPTGTPMYPAAYGSVLGVGALGAEGRWENSNYGDFVNIYAPGFAVLPVGNDGPPGTYAGTSIASAYVSRLIAAQLAKTPQASLAQILSAILNGGAE